MYNVLGTFQKAGRRGEAYSPHSGGTSPREGVLTAIAWQAPEEYPVLATCYPRGEGGTEPANGAFLPDQQIEALRKRYEFADDVAVRSFLETRSFLIQLLFTAYKEIQAVFDHEPHMVLKVVAEPEAQEEQELFLFIQTKLQPSEARALLNELYREWWLDAMLDAKGEMTISLQYV